jgi:hypothetical protein
VLIIAALFDLASIVLKEANAKSILLLAVATHFEVVIIHQISNSNWYLQILLFKVCRNLVGILFCM